MRYPVATVAFCLLIASCSPGSGQNSVAPGAIPYAASGPSATNGGTATVKGRIAIPIAPGLRTHYISPSTESVVVAVYGPHRKELLEKFIDVRSGAKGCKNTARQRICTFELSVPTGKIRFIIATLDRPGSKHRAPGNILSALITGFRAVKSGETIKLPMTLAGEPESVSMELDPYDTFAIGDDKQGFEFAGVGPELMHLVPRDADGSLIIGPGSPKLGLTSDDATDLSISKANSNSFVLRPRGGAVGVTLTATAKAAIKKGASVAEHVNVTLGSVLYVANHGSVTPAGSVAEYVPWLAAPILTITNGVNSPGVLTVDQSGNLWVGNNGGSVGAGSITEYGWNEATPSRTISGLSYPGVGGAESLAVDKSGNVYCACNQNSEVDEFTPTGGSVPSRTLTATNSPQGIKSPYSVVTDSSGNLYVANYGSDSIGISVFAPGASTAPIRNITAGIHGAWLLVMDRLGNLYAGNLSVPNTITEYAPDGIAPINTFRSSGLTSIDALAVDATGNVYAGNFSGTGATALQYAPSAPSSPARTLSLPSTAIFGLSADAIGNVYVSNSDNSTVKMYPPGTSTTPDRTLISSDGIDTPWYLTVSP